MPHDYFRTLPILENNAPHCVYTYAYFALKSYTYIYFDCILKDFFMLRYKMNT